MNKIVVIVAAAALLPGCALLPSRVPPLEVPVGPSTVVAPAPNTLEGQVVSNLNFAASRRTQYVAEYKSLSGEQQLRGAAILAASVALSATTVFRGDANSLKWAGFAVGTTTFYDKVIPISGRIAAAQSGYTNFNTLVQAGNSVLVYDLDSDKAALGTADQALDGSLDAANLLIKNDKPAAAQTCAPPITAQACTQTQLDAAQAHQAAITKLQASVTTATLTLASGVAAYKALVNIPADITATADTIDNVAWAGIAFTVDQTPLAAGVSVSSSPSAAHAPAAPQGVLGALNPNQAFSDANDQVVANTTAVQNILDRVDYVSLDTRIKSAAPPVIVSSGVPSKTPPVTKTSAN